MKIFRMSQQWMHLPEENRNRIQWASQESENRLPNLVQSDILPFEKKREIPWNGSEQVKIYRAVPLGIDDIRPGDWVALERDYAASMSRGHILEKTVPADEVVWAGTDLHEWFWIPESGR